MRVSKLIDKKTCRFIKLDLQVYRFTIKESVIIFSVDFSSVQRKRKLAEFFLLIVGFLIRLIV